MPYSPVLPSAQSALDFVQNKPGSGSEVIKHLLGRAAIIYMGFQAARLIGKRPPDNGIFFALLGASAIEAFVLYYIKTESQKP